MVINAVIDEVAEWPAYLFNSVYRIVVLLIFRFRLPHFGICKWLKGVIGGSTILCWSGVEPSKNVHLLRVNSASSLIYALFSNFSLSVVES